MEGIFEVPQLLQLRTQNLTENLGEVAESVVWNVQKLSFLLCKRFK